MQATRQPRSTRPASPPSSGWTYSRWSALLFASLAGLIVIGGLLYATWDHMPARVRYIPRYLQSQFLPARPHPEFVPTPAAAAAPEQALEGLQIDLTPREGTRLPAALPEEGAPAEAGSDPQESAPEEGAPAEGADAPQESAAPATAIPQPTAVPLFAAAPTALLEGVRHEYQGWNNCGPTTLAMQLSFWGRSESQQQTAPLLKPDPDDKNVSPEEMAGLARSLGMGSQVVVGLGVEQLQTLVSNGIPVIVESWYIPEPDDQMGHYLLLVGYEGETLRFYDSYEGPDQSESVSEFDALWKVFNRTAIVTWPPEKEPLVRSILGEWFDPQRQAELSLATAHAEVNGDPNDKFAWFNLGSSLVALGDYESAVTAFDTARALELPWRMLWYQFGPFEAYYNVGEYETVVALTTATLKSAGNLEESFYWRGQAQAALGNVEAARSDFQQALKLNSLFAPAQQALDQLP